MSEEKIGKEHSFLNFNTDEVQGIIEKNKSRLAPIDPELAAEIRANYNRFFLPPQLVTKDGERIRGFTFSREDFEMAVYGQKMNFAGAADGVHVSFAYHDGSIDRRLVGFTTVLHGVKLNEKDEEILIEECGRVRDYSKPCPKNCPIGAK